MQVTVSEAANQILKVLAAQDRMSLREKYEEILEGWAAFRQHDAPNPTKAVK
jgi:hypothetical protein